MTWYLFKIGLSGGEGWVACVVFSMILLFFPAQRGRWGGGLEEGRKRGRGGAGLWTGIIYIVLYHMIHITNYWIVLPDIAPPTILFSLSAVLW